MSQIHKIRHAIEKFVSEKLGGNWHGAGTNMITGTVDFSFDYEGRNYSVHINELKKED